MSVFAATALARARQDQADTTSSKLASADADSTNIIAKLTAFVPAEIITAWGVALTLMAPDKAWVRWVSLGVGVVVLLVIILLDLSVKDKQAKKENTKAQPVSRKRRLRLLAVAATSFVVWALATPGTPLNANAARFAVVGGLVITGIIVRYAALWDIEPIGSPK
jgi:hypothetical protein